jgi:glycosyltransferase involved in cell wall biosynthesis
MKRIAIVTDNFCGSSSSLAESLLHKGCNVDFYVITGLSDNSDNFESFNPSTVHRFCPIYKYTDFNANGLRRFLKYQDQFAMYFIRISSFSPYEKGLKSTFKQIIIPPLLSLYFRRLRTFQYDVINVVGQSYLSIALSKRLKDWKLPVVHSLHEVLANHLSGDSPYNGIEELVKSGIPIIVFSEESKETLLKHFPNYKSNVYVIPFSLFTGFVEYPDIVIPEISCIDDYLLYYGYIRPYKGLSVLYQSLPEDFEGKIVIAGTGYDSILEKLKSDSRFVLVNRWIGNAELATLIRHSRAIVCPYLSSSQSGIPVTVFNFDKPIIATRVPAFASLIMMGVNGYLVDINNVEQLREAVSKICLDDDYYQFLRTNLAQYHEQVLAHQWNEIAVQYLSMVSQIQ